MNNVNDLFTAGSDTIFQMLQWVVYLMAKYPELVKKMQAQIDEVVPRGRLVSLDDKPKWVISSDFFFASVGSIKWVRFLKWINIDSSWSYYNSLTTITVKKSSADIFEM